MKILPLPFDLSSLFCMLLGCACLVLNRPFLEKSERGEAKSALFYKSLASACFVLIAFLSLITKNVIVSSFHITVMVGLSAGFLGDILLALRHIYPKRRNLFFVVGAILFCVEHLLYIGYFALTSTSVSLSVFFFTIGFSVASFVFARTKVDGGKLRLGIYVYISIVMLMCATTVANAVTDPDWTSFMIAIAGVSFAASDVILCVHNFGQAKSFKQMYLIHYLYYPAQVLFALCLLTAG